MREDIVEYHKSKSNNSLLSDINEFEDEDDDGVDDECIDEIGEDDTSPKAMRKSISIRLPGLATTI